MSQKLKAWSYLLREMSDQTAQEYIDALKSKTPKIETMAEQTEEKAQAQAGRKISAPEVIKLLGQGYTRYKKDDRGFGSIQEKFDLTFSQVREVFSYPRLKGLKTKFPGIEIIDEEEATEEAPREEQKVKGKVAEAPPEKNIFE